jgi:hypothetical protein
VERTLGHECPLMAPSKLNLLPRGYPANDKPTQSDFEGNKQFTS